MYACVHFMICVSSFSLRSFQPESRHMYRTCGRQSTYQSSDSSSRSSMYTDSKLGDGFLKCIRGEKWYMTRAGRSHHCTTKLLHKLSPIPQLRPSVHTCSAMQCQEHQFMNVCCCSSNQQQGSQRFHPRGAPQEYASQL